MLKLMIILLYLSKEAFDAIINYLNSRHRKGQLPDNVKDVYNEQEYQNWISYEKERGRAGIVSNVIDIGINLALLISNAYARIFEALPAANRFTRYLLFILLFTLIGELLDLPFEYHDTFVTEEKYGLNRSTKKTFFLDVVKSLLIQAVLTCGFVILVMLLFERFGNLAILWCCAIMVAISLAAMLIVVPLMRLYNKFEPLEDGELKDRLLALCEKYGIHIRKVVVRDASRRTSRSNAFCSGIGKYKTISLDDNLVREYTPEEVTAVFAHEFAHAKYHHSAKSLPFSMISLLLVFTSLSIVLNTPGLYTAFGFTGINYYFAFMLTSIIIWPISTLMDIAGNALSRRHEYQADAFAAKEGYGEDLIRALKHLSKEALSDINPHPAAVVLSYSHPTLSERIRAIEAIEQGK